MVPKVLERADALKWFPRQRGDGPSCRLSMPSSTSVPPPARGWSVHGTSPQANERGSPASAGMVPPLKGPARRRSGFPRQRGDGPEMPVSGWRPSQVPPPARGWSPDWRHSRQSVAGSPASAGMVRTTARSRETSSGFPRQRGDGPLALGAPGPFGAVPPPARGWSSRGSSRRCVTGGSPASAGMVRKTGRRSAISWGFPRQRGDGPPEKGDIPAEMGFPRQRGDGPYGLARIDFESPVPPPARGWSQAMIGHPRHQRGSPASAGMVLIPAATLRRWMWFPRQRGDGPEAIRADGLAKRVPPPARGWSLLVALGLGPPLGSPASAGMVPGSC